MLRNTPIGSAGCRRASTYTTCTPLTLAGEVGGASATTTRENVPPANAVATAGVVGLSVWVNVRAAIVRPEDAFAGDAGVKDAT